MVNDSPLAKLGITLAFTGISSEEDKSFHLFVFSPFHVLNSALYCHSGLADT